MDLSLTLSFLAVAVLLTLAPGPDILFVIAQSISNGRKAGILTALGLASGVIVHTLAAALGITAVLYNSAFAFQLIKYAGALYLLYLAYQAIRDGATPLTAAAPVRQKGIQLYRTGVLMNILNPKVSLFFLALLPQFVTHGTGNEPLQMMLLGVIFMVQAIVVFSLVALFAGQVGSKLMARPKVGKYVNYGKAVLYAAIGLRLALAEK
ncbi:LysE family translocator [Brevibacillus sp. TJ4]|uniref:LysE family translocator n=1 Tax=Brevibacillus sp. TJ4 TaxID=3234853 RepID=UPI0037CEC213